ncbi:hypothetical protein [Actinomadura rubrisoli]|uniref:Uncharacterized protein n=1 Tax=Actinomadura rubrisoli TaxID=2530368 RepID=A0A4R5CIM9_9ACTN|nr:hypothetical protein [Actinomadura rubrisoli]TDD97194.1 hypothetical protein E1298_01795 [Actinomadura rubrisoli]
MAREWKVTARLVVSVAAAVVREEGGWVNGHTAERVYAILTGDGPPIRLLKKDRAAAVAAMKWLMDMSINELSRADFDIRAHLTHCYNYKCTESDVGRIAVVMAIYQNREKYERSIRWRNLARHSKHLGEVGQFLDECPFHVKVTKKRVDTLPYYTACKCNHARHGDASKKAGGCATAEKRHRDRVTYTLVDEKGWQMFKYSPDPKSDHRPWPTGLTLLIRRAKLKGYEEIRPSRGGEPVNCNILTYVDALPQ